MRPKGFQTNVKQLIGKRAPKRNPKGNKECLWLQATEIAVNDLVSFLDALWPNTRLDIDQIKKLIQELPKDILISYLQANKVTPQNSLNRIQDQVFKVASKDENFQRNFQVAETNIK